MEKEGSGIMKCYNESVLQEALLRYGGDKHTISNLEASESFVYAYEAQGNEYILKIRHSSVRSADQIRGELDWLHFLSNNGVRVSGTIPSKNDKHIEIIEVDNSYFTAVAYEKARGKMLDGNRYDPALLEQWGQIMGKMHNLAKLYQPADPVYKRPEWHESMVMYVKKWLPDSETAVREKWIKLYEQLQRLPKGNQDYGLIHSDLHHRNFFVDQGKITVIDFDDLQYHWFINDIAKTLYNEAFIFSVKPQNRNSFARFFLKHFMNGYRKENRMDAEWKVLLQDFMRLRHLFIFIRLFEHLDIDGLSEKEEKRLTEHKSNIVQGTPLLDLDFDSI